MIDWMCEHWVLTIVLGVLSVVSVIAITVAVVAVSIIAGILDAFFKRF